MNKLEDYVKKHGESYRDLIQDALSWLRSRESEWGIMFDESHDDGYIEDLISHIHKGNSSEPS